MNEAEDPYIEELRDLVALAGNEPGRDDPQRYVTQLAGIEAKLEQQRTRRAATVVIGGVLVGAMAAAIVGWVRLDARIEATEVREHYQAPAWGDADPSIGRMQVTKPEPRAVIVRDQPMSPPEPPKPKTRAQPRRRPAPAPETSPAPTSAVGPDDLLRRANVARAAHELDEARAALLELRERFPGAEATERATFLLGRIEHELAGDAAAAARWLARYVEEYPSGRFVAAARGRVLQSRARSGDIQGARDAARDYLAHHPEGAYADLARRTLSPGEER